MTTWQERFYDRFPAKYVESGDGAYWDEREYMHGHPEPYDIVAFISEERNAVARDVLERIAKAFANVETDDQVMFIVKFAVELQKLGEEYSI